MASGSEHYREAEYWLTLAEGDAAAAATAKAGVHALLALAAAALNDAGDEMLAEQIVTAIRTASGTGG